MFKFNAAVKHLYSAYKTKSVKRRADIHIKVEAFYNKCKTKRERELMSGKKLTVSRIKLLMKGCFFLNEQIVLCFLFKINTTQNEEIIIVYPEDILDIKHHYITIE